MDVLSTTTTTPGSSANVTITGNAPSQRLAFTIPAGVKGDTGASPTLSVNSSVSAVSNGTAGSASVNTTDPLRPVLSLTLPAGPTGDTGAGYDGVTSSTTLTNATTQTVTVNKVGAFTVGSFVRFAKQSNPVSIWCDGSVTAISGTSVTVAFFFNALGGAGGYPTSGPWNISIIGARGATGAAGAAGTTDYTGLTNVPSTFAPSAHKSSHTSGGSDSLTPSDIGAAAASHTHTKSQITDFPTFATVATSGSYTDLSNKPTIPTLLCPFDPRSSIAFSYSGSNISTLTYTYGGTTQGYADFGYDGSGNLQTVTYKGSNHTTVLRTITFSYSGGNLSGYTVA